MTIIAEKERPADPFAYLSLDEPDPETLALIGVTPKRWGRMDRFSRLAVVEVGRVLRSAGLLREQPGGVSALGSGGLIGASRHGSLATDLAYARTLAGGINLASPTLFSYTLPNIALAEAASHYGLTGPVYSLFAPEAAAAEAEARRWLAERPGPDFMVAGLIDIRPAAAAPQAGPAPAAEAGEIVLVNFKIVR
jgi:3-oxoacyl-(acyl-carrier-protein) synthase